MALPESRPVTNTPKPRANGGRTISGGISDLPLDDWREYDDIFTDSLWVLGDRDNSGAHDGFYHGNFIPQIPHQLMRRYTKTGGVVLDGFLGSGTMRPKSQCSDIIPRMGKPPSRPSADISYEEATAAILSDNGGYAPVRLIERELGKYKDLTVIKGKTPIHTVHALLQRKERFVRLRLGVYALADYQPPEPPLAKTKKDKEMLRHSDIQGMLISIGNDRRDVEWTYTADKNAMTKDGAVLGKLTTLDKPYPFTYERQVKRAGLVDVVWFNERKYPSHFFEVEHTTNFVNALTKFCDLQDFNAQFFCVADDSRRARFDEQLERPVFKAMQQRCTFRTYKEIESDYKKAQQKEHIL